MAGGSNYSTGAIGSSLATPDYVIVIVYLVGILAVGLWASMRSSRSTLKGYFLAGSKMSWWPVGASLFASNIGCEHFIGLAGYGAANGISVAAYEINGMFIFVLLGWYFLPVYLASRVYTMPEYLNKRFGGQRIRVYLAILSLILSVLTKISVALFTGALFVQQALGWNLYPAVIILLTVTAIYTVMGGLAAVIYTDAAQTAIMIGGAAVLMILCKEVSWDELQLEYPLAIPRQALVGNISCGLPREDAFHLFRHPIHSDLPWPAMIFGITVSATWYVCADQVMVQRALAAKSVAHAKGGCILVGFLKSLPLFLMVYPGMISRVFFTDAVACVDSVECMKHCQSEVGCSNIAYPKLVVNIMPIGLKGLMLAVIMSSLMSSLTSIFNSSSTIFTIDIWTRFRPRAKETELMVVGRVFILVLVVIGILWISIIQSAQGGRLFDYIQSITSYLAPPICAVFVLAVSWKRTNEKGAFWGLMFGFVIGLIRMAIDFTFTAPACGEIDTRPTLLANWHYLYFGVFLFGVVSIFTIVVSLLTEPLPERYIRGLTFWTRKDKLITDDEPVIEVREEGRQESRENEDVSCGRRFVDVICGTGQDSNAAPTAKELDSLEKLSSLAETRTETIILNATAIFMLGCSLVLWVVFA
ncbi:sodium/glucose cotransporter 4-like [Apostichopus japonicus]|uniref:sodium/glucose cotransporter 4-like n=1 Tax=Stichopus japonicus TaxID=307972 RepID=UPI003AB59589